MSSTTGNPRSRAARNTVALVVALFAGWIALTWLFWVGYVGSDDAAYARYAYLLHRPPINWWEFRMPSIMALRTAFSLLGPTEFAASLPTLLASLALAVSVAWTTGLWRGGDWKAWASVALAVTMPIDISFRSLPTAPFLAAGLLATGSACILERAARAWVPGCLLFATALMTHEVSVFYIGVFLLAALAVDIRRFAAPAALCITVCVLFVALESLAYRDLLGDPFARYRTAAGTTASLAAGHDPDTGISGAAFYLWPLRNVLFSKHFGFNLGLLLVTGLMCLRNLEANQRVLWFTTFGVLLWLGYGTQVPWAYKPLYRQFHYYAPLTFSIACLLPVTVASAIRRPRASQVVIAFCLLTHIAATAAGGRWGQQFDVSRDLLAHARRHPLTWFVTDVETMNDMYVVSGFRLPANVACLNGPAVEGRLLANKEPQGVPRVRFPEVPIGGLLINLEGLATKPAEPEFARLVAAYAGSRRRTVTPPRMRLLFRPLQPFIGNSSIPGFMVQSLGGEAVEVAARHDGPEL